MKQLFDPRNVLNPHAAYHTKGEALTVKRHMWWSGLAVGATVLLSACGSSAANPSGRTSPRAGGNVGVSATTLIQEATSASKSLSSYHVRASFAFSQHIDTWDTRVAGAEMTGTLGSQVIGVSGALCCSIDVHVTRIGGTDYYQGDPAALAYLSPGNPSPPAGETCMSQPTLGSSSDEFAEADPIAILTQASSLETVKAQFSVGAVAVINGVRVVPIHIAPPDVPANGFTTMEILITADGPAYLAGFSAPDGSGPGASFGHSGYVAYYTDWNKPLGTVMVPSPCTPKGDY